MSEDETTPVAEEAKDDCADCETCTDASEEVAVEEGEGVEEASE